MKTELTQEQIDSYRENGFLAIEGFLDDAELAHWRIVTDDAVRSRLSDVSAGTAGRAASLTNQGDPAAYYSNVFTQCIHLAETHEGMRELMYDPRLGEAAGTLAGVDGIRIWHDQALIKQPFGNPTAWHLDDPYWSFHSRDAISIWVALDDATLLNGAMMYIPGSHKKAQWENAPIGEGLGELFDIYPEWKKIDPLPVPVPAGSAVFHNGLTAHGAGANMTARPRRAMTCAYMPNGSTFNGQSNVLPPEYLATLRVGDVLNNDAVNPLIWRR
jgi:phytanoyl-CoA hydroxylase